MDKYNYLIKFKEVWGDEYDYSKFKYTLARKDGIIICNKHGEFLKSPNKHTRRSSPQGCPMCSREKASYRQCSVD